MAIFALVSQSLRTGEPIHQIMPTSLLDRLIYHSTYEEFAQHDGERQKLNLIEGVSSLEFLHFATGKRWYLYSDTCSYWSRCICRVSSYQIP